MGQTGTNNFKSSFKNGAAITNITLNRITIDKTEEAYPDLQKQLDLDENGRLDLLSFSKVVDMDPDKPEMQKGAPDHFSFDFTNNRLKEVRTSTRAQSVHIIYEDKKQHAPEGFKLPLMIVKDKADGTKIYQIENGQITKAVVNGKLVEGDHILIKDGQRYLTETLRTGLQIINESQEKGAPKNPELESATTRAKANILANMQQPMIADNSRGVSATYAAATPQTDKSVSRV